jgi:hypothetical protein
MNGLVEDTRGISFALILSFLGAILIGVAGLLVLPVWLFWGFIIVGTILFAIGVFNFVLECIFC